MNTDMYLVPGTHDCFWVGSSTPLSQRPGWETSTPAASDSAPTRFLPLHCWAGRATKKYMNGSAEDQEAPNTCVHGT